MGGWEEVRRAPPLEFSDRIFYGASSLARFLPEVRFLRKVSKESPCYLSWFWETDVQGPKKKKTQIQATPQTQPSKAGVPCPMCKPNVLLLTFLSMASDFCRSKHRAEKKITMVRNKMPVCVISHPFALRKSSSIDPVRQRDLNPRPREQSVCHFYLPFVELIISGSL